MASEWRELAPNLGTIGVFSSGIARIPYLEQLLGATRMIVRPRPRQASELDAIVGWGHKPTAHKARAYAALHGLPYIRLEDGFLRSASIGHRGHPLSLVIDDMGIYYDATGPSRLEALLNGTGGEQLLNSAELLTRARHCRARIIEGNLSKYNSAIDPVPRWLLELSTPRVLVVDQTWGDASVELGNAGSATFNEMLDCALQEHPGATIVVKTHPDVWSGRKHGYLDSVRSSRVRVLRDAVDPAALLEAVDHIYTVTSQLGFEALLREKRVTCFGTPFYAGWGLTQDRNDKTACRRQCTRSLDELVAAALILYPRYIDPITLERCEVERVIEHLALQRAMYERNAFTHYCFGFSRWKREYVRHYLKSPSGKVVFCRNLDQVKTKDSASRGKIVIWGVRQPPGVEKFAAESGIPICRMEDGFLRSVGLGSDFAAPLSLVMDDAGMYYDPSRCSDLEHILLTAEFSTLELAKARTLIDQILCSEVSKYNFSDESSVQFAPRKGQKVLLVPGQVNDDASVVLGSSRIRSNVQLLQYVRRCNPDAYIAYKVHPDVLSGNRSGGDLAELSGLYDYLVERAPLGRCLEAVDEVHTMTSLVGFEALLRGKRVVTYGQPFYAGWGLTEDHDEIVMRRSRSRSVEELVAGVLLRYPRYYSWRARAFTSPEMVIRELKARRACVRAEMPTNNGALRRGVRRAFTWFRSKPNMIAPLLTNIVGRRVLLLQGPVGPFFQRLAKRLRMAGAEVTKINFNTGDTLFYPTAEFRYRGTRDAWAAYLARVVEERRIDTIMLFGDTRYCHRVALDLAKERGIDVYVFEEGYIRPDYVTIERDGVNARSRLPRELGPYLDVACHRSHSGKVRRTKHGFAALAWYSLLYSLALTTGQWRYPHYQHHKDLNAFRMAPLWLRGLARKGLYSIMERGLNHALTTRYSGAFFLVPLQVYHDSQVVNSAYGSNERFIEEVLISFANDAPKPLKLVFKHHPLDRAYSEYGPFIRRLARELGIADRVYYVHDLHLPTLLRAAIGTVVLNSTTGCSSLHHGTPVKVLGDAVYDIEGLTFQGTLKEFWNAPGDVDIDLFRRYRSGLIQMSQLNGCFYSMDVSPAVVQWLNSQISTTAYASCATSHDVGAIADERIGVCPAPGWSARTAEVD